MEHPNSKRAKMDNPNGQSSSTNPQDQRSQRKLINVTTQNFAHIRYMPGFVDHTHFIQTFINITTNSKTGQEQTSKTVMGVFAPRRMGKSSHLNMVWKFLEIEVDKTTRMASSSVKLAAEKRKNYEVFKGTRIINNDKLVQKHLGRHPVIFLDFKGASNVKSVETAKMHCREAVHIAYKRHWYLKTSKKLVPDDEESNAECQNICAEWCSHVRYKNQDLKDSLVNLTKYLYNHFDGAKVYILVDEFDAINVNAECSISKKKISDHAKVDELRDVCAVLEQLFSNVTKEANEHIGGALFTGVSYVSGVGYSPCFNNMEKIKFLDSRKGFVPFYGATKEEVKSLIEKLVERKELVNLEGKKYFMNIDKELDATKIMNFVQSRYNGYFDHEGTQIFCLWSVLQYLQNGVALNYWNETGGINDLDMILKSEKIANEILKLMSGEMIEFERLETIDIMDVVQLNNLLVMENKNEVNFEVVFNVLLDLGFLTYPEGEAAAPEEGSKSPEEGAQRQKFKLLNAEIRKVLSDMMRRIVTFHWDIDPMSLTDYINDISSFLVKEEVRLREKMSDVYKAASSLLKELENETRIACVMYKALNDAKSFELTVDLKIKDAEGKSITLDRPDYLLNHKEENVSILWKLKYNKSRTDKSTTSLHALQEARGIATTKNGKTKNYVDSLKKLGRETLVIGLSVASDNKVSLSYALNTEEKIFFMSDWESSSFQSFYQGCIPVPLSEKNDD